jgi:YVTN family beta-propeller protein
VDVTTGETTCEIATDQDISHMLVVTPDGTRAFVANIGSGTVSVLDLAAKALVRNVPTGKGAEGIDVTPDGQEVWVTNRDEDTVSVIDVASLEVVATVASESFPIRARVTPNGAHVLVSNARSGLVRVFDTRTREQAHVIDLDAGKGETEGRLFGDRFGDSSVPIGIVISPEGSRAFVAHANADVISVIDLSSWTAVGTLTAGKEPDGMAYVPAPKQ